ncbi:MAG: type I restriction enzyme HsdR N-terminal domain-containing protein [Verrucomicrobiota bacterium]
MTGTTVIRKEFMKIPKKVIDRLPAPIKRYTQIAEEQRSRDVAEADTVTLVKDIMADCFGYDKYSELTSEQQIRGTYCDLAIKIENKIQFLVEVKAAGIQLNDSHVNQAINYGANEGIEWVVLTNALDWRLYRIRFSQPIEREEVTSFSLAELNLKNQDDLKKVFLLCREGLSTGAMDSFHQTAQILNRHTISEIIQTDAVIGVIRREFRKLFPDVKIDPSDVSDMLVNDILKREVTEGDKVKEAKSRVKKAARKLEKKKEKAAQAKEAAAIQPSTENLV